MLALVVDGRIVSIADALADVGRRRRGHLTHQPTGGA